MRKLTVNADGPGRTPASSRANQARVPAWFDGHPAEDLEHECLAGRERGLTRRVASEERSALLTDADASLITPENAPQFALDIGARGT